MRERQSSELGTRQDTLLVAVDSHFLESNGVVYSPLALQYGYWAAYLSHFSRVYVLARVKTVETVPEGIAEASGPNVTFLPVNDFYGPRGLIRNASNVIRGAWRASRYTAVFLLRNGMIGTILWLMLGLRRKPYAREIQGHMRESISIWTSSKKCHPLRSIDFTPRVAELLTRIQSKRATAVSYVSIKAQQAYPAKSSEREFVFSSVNIDQRYVGAPRNATFFSSHPKRLLSIGRLETEKGHAHLLQALSVLSDIRPGLDWHLSVVGPGSQLSSLQLLAKQLNLNSRVTFLGRLGRADMINQIDEAHLFILPSLTEGLPRALVEVMARGLPSLGSDVGGVPELLPRARLVPPRAPSRLADALARHLSDPAGLAAASHRDFEYALARYSPETMSAVRSAFLTTAMDHA